MSVLLFLRLQLNSGIISPWFKLSWQNNVHEYTSIKHVSRKKAIMAFSCDRNSKYYDSVRYIMFILSVLVLVWSDV